MIGFRPQNFAAQWQMRPHLDDHYQLIDKFKPIIIIIFLVKYPLSHKKKQHIAK